MKTVTEVSRLTGISVRTLHHYDAIGLLKPSRVTEAGYRLYNDQALEKLQLILLFRELEFPLKEIKQILNAPDFDRNRILEQQIALLQARRQRLDSLVLLAKGIKLIGVSELGIKQFDFRTIADQAAQAKVLWSKTEAYREFEEKSKGRSKDQESDLGQGLMDLFRELGALKDLSPASPEAANWVRLLQGYITTHFYTCTPQFLLGLGRMYAGGGSFTENINAAGGPGTAAFAGAAIELYCREY